MGWIGREGEVGDGWRGWWEMGELWFWFGFLREILLTPPPGGGGLLEMQGINLQVIVLNYCLGG